MNFAAPRLSGVRRWCGALIVLLLASRTALAFFPEPNPSFLDVGGTGVVNVKGSSTSAHVDLTTVTIWDPTLVSSDFLPAVPRMGTGKVLVTLTGLKAGTTTVTFSGTNNGFFVSGSITVIVFPTIGTTAQVPQVGRAGDPVSTATGEHFGTEAVDLDLGGPMPLMFARHAASGLAADGQADGNLGQNRLHNFASKIVTVVPALVQVILPTGRVLRFQKVGVKWTLLKPLDVPYVLVEAGTSLLLGDPHTKQIWTYNSSGQLVKIEDGKGNAHTLSYTGGNLTGVSDGLGRSLTLAYSSNLISSVTDHTSTRQVTFAYTGNVLTSATDYGGHTTTYGNSGGLPTSVTRPAGNTLLTQSYTGGKVTSETERGTDTSTLSYGASTTTFTDPTAATLVHTYGTDGRLASYADEAGRVMTMTYDSTGRRSSVLDRLGDKTTTVFNALNGLPTTITNAEGRSATFTYKARVLSGITFYDLIKITCPDGAARSFTYDAMGNTTLIADELGKAWKYTFNNRGQILTATNPLLGATTYTYDAAGNRASSQEPDVGVTSYTHDTRFRLTQISRPGPPAANVVIVYDQRDRITSITDERGKTVTFAYDSNDRLTTVTDPDSNNTTYAYDVLDRVLSVTDRAGKTTSRTFNSRHLIDSVTDRNGNTTTRQFDPRQRPISTTDAGGQVWTRTFDDEGLLVSAANPVNPASEIKRNHLGQPVEMSDALGNTTTLVRDAMQRVTKTFDPLGRQTTFAYDKRGQLISAADQGAGTATFTRDGLGNVTKITDPNANAWNATFLKSGRLATMTDPLLKKWTYAYDTRGRLMTITYPDATTCSVSYDAASHVTGRQFSSGPNLVSTFDDLGRAATADGLIFSYDAESRLTNVQENGQNFSATYDDGGRLKTVGYLSGAVTVTYQYDTRNRLTQVTDSVTTTQIDFAYDNAGRLTGITRTPGVDGTFTYDAAGRLTRIQEAGVLDLHYALTPAGDVASVDYTATVTPAVTALTQVLVFGKAGQITTPGYTYDALGRLAAAPGVTFAWDGASRLINAAGVVLAYNGLGDVTTRTDGANVTRFYNHYALGMAPIVYEDMPGGGHRAYVWTPDGRLLYSINTATSQPTFYHFDRAGSTLALTDATGTVTDAYAYGPYGEPMPGRVGTSTQPFQYIGEHGVRAEGALYQMRARYYDPRAARFLSRDPLPPRLTDVRSLNRYEYASQHPLRYIDPLGERDLNPEVVIDTLASSVSKKDLQDAGLRMNLFDLPMAPPTPLYMVGTLFKPADTIGTGGSPAGVPPTVLYMVGTLFKPPGASHSRPSTFADFGTSTVFPVQQDDSEEEEPFFWWDAGNWSDEEWERFFDYLEDDFDGPSIGSRLVALLNQPMLQVQPAPPPVFDPGTIQFGTPVFDPGTIQFSAPVFSGNGNDASVSQFMNSSYRFCTSYTESKVPIGYRYQWK